MVPDKYEVTFLHPRTGVEVTLIMGSVALNGVPSYRSTLTEARDRLQTRGSWHADADREKHGESRSEQQGHGHV